MIEELRQLQPELQTAITGLEEKVADRTKLLTEKMKELSFLAGSIPSISWTSDSNGKLDYINHRWHERNPINKDFP